MIDQQNQSAPSEMKAERVAWERPELTRLAAADAEIGAAANPDALNTQS